VVVGSPREDPSGRADAGAVRVYGAMGGTILRQYLGGITRGDFGASVRSAGDVDNDGYPDYLAGARYEVDAGRAHVFTGRTFERLRIHTGVTQSWYAQAVSGAGDVDGDNFDDIVIGAPFDRPAGLAPPGGDGPPATLAGSVQVRSGRTGTVLLSREGVVEYYGHAVSDAGDINGDDFEDILVGSPLGAGCRGRVEVLSVARLSLIANPMVIPIAAGGSQVWLLDATPAEAGTNYLLLGTTTGTKPGVNFGPVNLPLNVDSWTITTLTSVNQFPFTNTGGVLDPLGQAVARFTMPGGILPPTIAGLRFNHAFLLSQGATVTFASNPVPLLFTN